MTEGCRCLCRCPCRCRVCRGVCRACWGSRCWCPACRLLPPAGHSTLIRATEHVRAGSRGTAPTSVAARSTKRRALQHQHFDISSRGVGFHRWLWRCCWTCGQSRRMWNSATAAACAAHSQRRHRRSAAAAAATAATAARPAIVAACGGHGGPANGGSRRAGRQRAATARATAAGAAAGRAAQQAGRAPPNGAPRACQAP